MRREYIIQATPGREGWVYLIHAQGTNRYKVGRSSNPVVRHQILQKQSPYPLEIIDSFWSVDAVNDEAAIHATFAEQRAYGEWFEFLPNEESHYISLDYLKRHFSCPLWIKDSKLSTFIKLIAYLDLHHLGSTEEHFILEHHLGHLIDEAYENVGSQTEYANTEAAVEEAINRIKSFCVSKASKLEAKSAYKEVELFTIGVFSGLAIALGKGRH